MASHTSTPVTAIGAFVPPAPRRPQGARSMLSPPPADVYCRLVDDTPETPTDATPMTWAQYVTWAASRAGSVNELAARAGLHRGTITAWKRGKKSPDTATVNSIRKVAAAVGDDPRHALRAAGRGALADKEPPPPPTTTPPLAAQLEAINRRIDAIIALGLDPAAEAEAIRTQQTFADQVVESWRRTQAQPDTDGRRLA